MSNSRILRIVGEINEEAFLKFSEDLSDLYGASTKPITLELFSEGGYASAAMAIVGKMLASPVTINVVGYGEVHSAAILIIAAGATRAAGVGTSFMVHEDSLKVSGNTTEIYKTAKRMEAEEGLWADMLGKFTTTDSSEWLRLSHNETYFDPARALELGLIDRVLNGKRK